MPDRGGRAPSRGCARPRPCRSVGAAHGRTSRSRRSLEHYLDPVTAREVDALVEGLVLHGALSTDPMDATRIRSALHRLAG